jgi:hypothetical protein
MGGQIVDASIIQAPRQRMTKEEKETIKAGGIPAYSGSIRRVIPA